MTEYTRWEISYRGLDTVDIASKDRGIAMLVLPQDAELITTAVNQVFEIAEKYDADPLKVAGLLKSFIDYIERRANEPTEIVEQLRQNPDMSVDYSGILARDGDLARKLLSAIKEKE